MNELDVLESLKALPKVLSIGCETTMGNFFSQEFNIIEKALKRLKELEKAFVALSKDDEKTKKLLSKEIEKNRALEIIKPLVHLTKDENGCWLWLGLNAVKITQEQYDSLKEVLL